MLGEWVENGWGRDWTEENGAINRTREHGAGGSEGENEFHF